MRVGCDKGICDDWRRCGAGCHAVVATHKISLKRLLARNLCAYVAIEHIAMHVEADVRRSPSMKKTGRGTAVGRGQHRAMAGWRAVSVWKDVRKRKECRRDAGARCVISVFLGQKMRGYPTSRWLAKTTPGLNMPRESPHDETITVAWHSAPRGMHRVGCTGLCSGDGGIIALNENRYQ